MGATAHSPAGLSVRKTDFSNVGATTETSEFSGSSLLSPPPQYLSSGGRDSTAGKNHHQNTSVCFGK